MTGGTSNAGFDRPRGAGGVSLDQARRGESNEPKNEKIRPLGAEIVANYENGAKKASGGRITRTGRPGGAGGVSFDQARRDESNEPKNGQIRPLRGEMRLDDAIFVKMTKIGAKTQNRRYLANGQAVFNQIWHTYAPATRE